MINGLCGSPQEHKEDKKNKEKLEDIDSTQILSVCLPSFAMYQTFLEYQQWYHLDNCLGTYHITLNVSVAGLDTSHIAVSLLRT